jgi:hypothetical protein
MRQKMPMSDIKGQMRTMSAIGFEWQKALLEETGRVNG